MKKAEKVKYGDSTIYIAKNFIQYCDIKLCVKLLADLSTTVNKKKFVKRAFVNILYNICCLSFST